MKLAGLLARHIRNSFTSFIGKLQKKKIYSSDPGKGLMVGFYEGFVRGRNFFDKLSELRLQEWTRHLLIVPSDADHFLPCLSHFITYTRHTTKQLVRHSVSKTLLNSISSTSRSRESSISKKKTITLFRPIIRSIAWRGEKRVSEMWGCPGRQRAAKWMNKSYENSGVPRIFRGGVQQIQLRTEERERTGIWGR